MCEKDSLKKLNEIKSEFLQYHGQYNDSLEFILLINKAEPINASRQQIYADDIIQWCAEQNIQHFYETSAMLETNIVVALLQIAQCKNKNSSRIVERLILPCV